MKLHPSKRWLALLLSLQAAAHAAPLIELAPGEPTSFTATPWQYLSFTVNVSGGDEFDPYLTIEPLDVGAVEESFVAGPASTTFTWRVMPGQLKSGVLRLKVTDYTDESDILEVPVTVSNPSAPAWWASQGVLTGGTVRDFSPANVGQLKAITKAAYESLKAEYPALDSSTPEGVELAAYVASFSTTSGNYGAVAQGQAKNAANLVYRAMGAVTGKGDLGMAWTSDSSDDQSHAVTNIGQIKTLFSFPMPGAGGFNELPELELDITAPETPPDQYDLVHIGANASDPDGSIASVAFYVDGSLYVADTTSPYGFNWGGITPGTHVITAVAADNRGATRLVGESVPVKSFVDTPPNITITGITDALANSGKAAFVSPAVPVIAVTASDPDASPGDPGAGITKVQFYQGSTLLGEDTQAPYVMTMNPVLPPGEYPIKVVVFGESHDVGPGTGEATSSFTVTQRSGGQPSWIDLQEGVVDFTGTTYNGTTDSYMVEGSPTSNYGNLDVLITDNGPERGMLIKFDLAKVAALPVVRGEIQFRILTETSRDYHVYQVLRSWDESTVTWNSPWATAGATNTTTDRGSSILDTLVDPDTVGDLTIADISKSLMESWRDSPSTNYGVTIQDYGGYSGFPKNRLEVWSSEATTVANRPILRVFYRYP